MEGLTHALIILHVLSDYMSMSKLNWKNKSDNSPICYL